jgi:hypothetical protein
MEYIIPDFPEYKINDKGEVFSLYKFKTNVVTDTWRPVKWVLDKGIGYYLVTMVNATTKKRSNKFIHRLLGQAFISNPEHKAHINHIDGNKTNNTLANLEWSTPKENSQHAVDNGLTTFEYCEKAIIQCDKTTRAGLQTFKSGREAQDTTGVARQNISKVLRNKRNHAGGFYWKYLE